MAPPFFTICFRFVRHYASRSWPQYFRKTKILNSSPSLDHKDCNRYFNLGRRDAQGVEGGGIKPFIFGWFHPRGYWMILPTKVVPCLHYLLGTYSHIYRESSVGPCPHHDVPIYSENAVRKTKTWNIHNLVNFYSNWKIDPSKSKISASPVEWSGSEITEKYIFVTKAVRKTKTQYIHNLVNFYSN